MSRPPVIEVRGVEKTFRVPINRVDSLKERVTQPFTPRQTREIHALRGVSFDVAQGEFFGIVGRNGSGKSTLLKVMAGIYGADAGKVRMAGRLAPFIELGVGFNPELTARENVALNGVLMGLSRRDAARRLDAVLEFAELEEFVDLKLKNYSSGMMVRLAFAVMVQADADIMLIDEVLAVGDASFARKCLDVFHAKRRAGRTIVLVTHDMVTVRDLADRAMVLHGGELILLSDPEAVALKYYDLNHAGGPEGPGGAGGSVDFHADVVEKWLLDEAGERVEAAERGQPIGLHLVVEAHRDLDGPVLGIQVLNPDGMILFHVEEPLFADGGEARIPAGARVRVRAKLENPLLPGPYSLNCTLFRTGGDRGVLQVMRLFDFTVQGVRPALGMVTVDADISASLEHERVR